MRVARLVTNESCNQRCAFCNARRDVETPAFVAGGALLGRLEQAVEAGASRVVLTGGEPLLRPDLEAVTRAAKARGVAEVHLETNGLLLTGARLGSLRQAGLDLVRVHLPGWGDDWRRATGDTAPFHRVLDALHLLQAHQMPWEVALPIVRDTHQSLPRVPSRLLEEGLRPDALIVVAPSTAPDASSLASPAQLAACLETLVDAARTCKLPLRLAQETPFPPCLLSRPLHAAHLYSLTPGGAARAGFVRVEACASCEVADRCPGMPEQLAGRLEALSPKPVRDDRLRRRLTVIGSVDEQVKRELVTRSFVRHPQRGLLPSTVVRVNFLCNQACHFCFVSTHLPTAPDAQVEAAIVEAAGQGGEVVLSGGEPTLNAQLPRWVRLAKASGASAVELQTNATRLGNEALLAELAEAGVDLAFVSLHGASAATSDAVTNAPGTFEQTVAGLDALQRSAIALRVNFVFCELNRAEFPAFVRLVGERWPKAGLTISVAGAFTDLVPRTTQLIPRFSDLRAPLAEGLELARRYGLAVSGFESMCGIPMCQVPEDPALLAAYPEAIDDGSEEFVRAAACLDCDLKTRCFGVRSSYAALYGTDELVPVRLPAKAQTNER